MNEELIQGLKEFKKENTLNIYKQINEFRIKMSLLINNTKTGNLRNELSELNILFEKTISDYEERYKITQNI